MRKTKNFYNVLSPHNKNYSGIQPNNKNKKYFRLDFFFILPALGILQDCDLNENLKKNLLLFLLRIEYCFKLSEKFS